MIETLIDPILGITGEFPDSLFVLHHPSSGKYGCYKFDGIHGLACFSDETGAFRFAEFLDLNGMVSVEVSFDEARDIAKSRPSHVISIMLLDSLNDPKIHFVR